MKTEILTQQLIHFIDHLRHCGYHIGIEQFTSAQDLILALAAQGQLPTQLSRLRTLLAPILCHSPKEQAEFQYHFDNWIQQLEIVTPSNTPTIPTPVPSSETTLKHTLRQIQIDRRFWRGITIILVLVLTVSWGLNWLRSPEINTPLKCEVLPSSSKPSVIPETVPQPSPPEILPQQNNKPVTSYFSFLTEPLWFIALAPVLFFLLWHWWWQYRIQRFLTRYATTSSPDIKQLSVAAVDDQLFQSIPLLRIAQQLRKHIPRPARQLDIIATVEKTIQAGGWFTPVTGTQQTLPEYLVLIDRTTFKDHQAQLIDALINRLIKQEVFITRYYFDTDPRYCYPESVNSALLTLTELGERYPHHRLMIFAAGEHFINPITGQLVDWLEQLLVWSARILFTLEPLELWGDSEQQLEQANFFVMPFTEAGFTLLAEQINLGVWQPVDNFSYPLATSPFPELLSERPRRWLEGHTPNLATLTELLHQVQHFLGTEGYYWLSACAIYPEIRWQLTLYLGSHLNLLTEKRLICLIRLPWFRYGYMPNWLRKRLIADLTFSQERQIRQLLYAWFLTALSENTSSSLDLEIALSSPQSGFLAKWLLSWLAKQSQPPSPLRDYVFVNFMANKLSVKLPKALQHFVIQPARQHPWRFAWLSLFLIIPLSLLTIKYFDNTFQDRLVDGGFGPKMVWIPAGTFRMGDLQGGGDRDEQPVHEVLIKQRFAMSRYEITFAEYDRFAQATGSELPGDNGWGRGDRPVINVTWNDAVAYAKWLSDQTGECYRLPTEAEWEYAARAGTETKYWWGNTASHEYANYGQDKCCEGLAVGKDRWEYTAPVGSFACNPFGVCDMTGNVWEWTCSEYEDKYSGKELTCIKSLGKNDAGPVVIRGGSWVGNPWYIRAADRFRGGVSARVIDFGFRLLRQ